MISKCAFPAIFASLALVACDSKTDDGAAATSATTTAAASAPTAATSASSAAAGNKCEALGCKGEGTFFKKCRCDDAAEMPPAPFEAKRVDGYSFDKPLWEVTNKTDKDLHWGAVSIYYYDASGKQLETKIKDKTYKRSRMNGSTLTLKPRETKKIGLGFKKESAPKGAKDMEIVFEGWCYGTYKDKSSHLCISVGATPEERPKGG
jgi:hypothetical protein